MKDDIEFQDIGKKTPYKVPDGFFDKISEITLQKSKEREQQHAKILVLWKTVAVAASLAAVISIGYLTFSPRIQMDSKQTIQNKQSIEQQITPQQQKNLDQKTVPEKQITGQNKTEVFGDVLPDLSDEELLQIAAVYKTDPFIGESEQ